MAKSKSPSSSTSSAASAAAEPHEVFRLNERDAQDVVLVRAVEESDRRGDWLPIETRRDATAQAGEKRGWLARRARLLAAALERREPALGRLRRWTRLGRGLALPIGLVALVSGLATNALGPEKRIHVLAVPLLGLILWNVTILALILLRQVLPLPLTLREAPRLLDGLEALVRRLVERLPSRNGEGAPTELRRVALRRFLALWLPLEAPLAGTRLRRALHIAALMVVGGVVAGMYWRGIVFAYEATWESTFLSGGVVEDLLGMVLAPASWLLGIPVPDAASIQAPNFGPAAPWIHLWAMTAALFVGLPRLVLALAETLHLWRRARWVRLEIPATYLRRLRSAASTETHRVEVLPFSWHPAAATLDVLRARLHDLLGARAEIRVRSSMEYGTEAAAVELEAGRLWLVLFSLGQTPELEVHGALLAKLRTDLPDGKALVAMVDASAWRERLPPGAGGEKRMEERRRAWDRMATELKLPLTHVDLRRDAADALVLALGRGAWPTGTLEER